MTDEPAGNRYCAGTPTENPSTVRLTGRIMTHMGDGLSGFVICRCARVWACADPDTIPRSDGRLLPSAKPRRVPIPDAGYFMDRA